MAVILSTDQASGARGVQHSMVHTRSDAEERTAGLAGAAVEQPPLLRPRRRSLTQSAGDSTNTTVRVLHYNDLYARIEAAQAFGKACTGADETAGICFGGMARLVTAARAARGGGGGSSPLPTLTLDAGDVSSGTLWGVVYPGRNITARLQALVGVDAMTLGNQEFEAGLPALTAYLTALNASGIPALGGCNVDAGLEPALAGLIRKWAVKSVGGVQVGILGYVTTDTRSLTATGGLRFAEVVPAMQACVAEFQKEHPGVKLLIALGHAGYEVDQQVAAQVPGLALVVGGHSQTFLYGTTGLERGPPLVAGDASSGQAPQGPYPTLVNGPTGDMVPVVQAGSLSRYLGQIDITVNGAGRLLSATGAPILLGGAGSSHPVERDAAALAAIAEAAAPVRALESQVIGTLPAELSAAPAVMLTGEAPLGNLICDAMMWYMRNTSALAPDACLINGGAARASLPAGNVTMAAVLTALPFSNTLVVKRLRGLAVISALETGLSSTVLGAGGGVPSTGEFPQVGGLRFRWQPAAGPQQRLRSVEVFNASAGAWAPLQPCAWYAVLTNDYLASGGDHYASFGAADALTSNGVAKSLVVQEYIKAAMPALPYSGSVARSARCNATAGVACTAAPPWAASPAAAAAASCPVSLTLLHYNDVHSRLDPQTASASPCSPAEDAAGGCYGGMARIAAFVKSVRQQQQGDAAAAAAALVLNAGDMTLGSLYDVAHNDRRTSAAAQNAVGEDAFVLGSHEFDFGLDALVAYLRLLRAPVLVANLNASARPDLAALVRPYTVVELGNTGVRAGIVGWTDPEGQFTSKVAPVLLTPVLPAVQSAVAALKAEYGPLVNIIIGLSHAGLDQDGAVAAAVGDLDVIVGGKDQVFMYGTGNGTRGPALTVGSDSSGQRATLPYPTLGDSAVVEGKEVPMVQAFYAGRYVGRFTLNFTAAGDATGWAGNPVLMGGNRSASPIPPDPAVRQLILQFAGELTAAAAEVIGVSDVTLSGARPAIRMAEVPLGNAVCDGLRAYLRTYDTTIGSMISASSSSSTSAGGLATDVCLLNSGSFRANINQGTITTGGIYSVLPFGNSIAVVNVTGAQLLASLENSVSATDWTDPPGRFAQVSGVAFSYDPAAPVGARLLSAALRPGSDQSQSQQTPINPCAHYLVLTNDFMSTGGDGYADLAAAPKIDSLKLSLEVAFMDYVRGLQGAPLMSGVYQRILRCENSTVPGCPAARALNATCPAAAPLPSTSPAPSPAPSSSSGGGNGAASPPPSPPPTGGAGAGPASSPPPPPGGSSIQADTGVGGTPPSPSPATASQSPPPPSSGASRPPPAPPGNSAGNSALCGWGLVWLVFRALVSAGVVQLLL